MEHGLHMTRKSASSWLIRIDYARILLAFTPIFFLTLSFVRLNLEDYCVDASPRPSPKPTDFFLKKIQSRRPSQLAGVALEGPDSRRPITEIGTARARGIMMTQKERGPLPSRRTGAFFFRL
jgi:hypothetical protein